MKRKDIIKAVIVVIVYAVLITATCISIISYNNGYPYKFLLEISHCSALLTGVVIGYVLCYGYRKRNENLSKTEQEKQ